MAEAHKGLHLATVQFNAIVEDMQTAMEQLDIPYSVQNRLLALLAPMHRDVVTR
jgi:hemoglobin